MKRLQYFQHRLQTLSALRDAIGAMRSLSAHHFRRARAALPAARSYRDEINTMLAEMGLRQTMHPDVSAGMLLLASDLGLCGDYNSRLSTLAITEAQQHGVQTLYSVGRRARSALSKVSLSPSRVYDAPASLEGISRLLMGLAQDLLEDYFAKRIGCLYVVSAGFQGVGHFQPQSARVLPIVPPVAAAAVRPSPYVDLEQLAWVAVREYLYITLYEVLLDALAAEHGMRLMSAESALEWLEGTAAGTSRQLTTARSEASTQELLDIVSGSRQRLREHQ